jgi:UDP-N-acetyl-2-amino-2-deoxyglucuronate dehydrogenase
LINFVLIGCGKIGKRHATFMSTFGKLLAVCDVDKNSADALANQFGVPAFYAIEDLLNTIQNATVAAVCTPNGLHAKHSIQLLNTGLHVICEKPMALTVEDCNKMIAAAEKNKKYLFCVKQNRFNPPVAIVKKLIDEGILGKIYSIQLNCFWNRNDDYYLNSWHGTKDLDGGTLFTQFSHFIDLLYWMFGDVKHVEALIKNCKHQNSIEFEDTGVAMLQFETGIIGTINYTVNSFEQNMEGSLTIFGEKGTVKIGGQYLNEIAYQCIKNYLIENLPEGNAANHYGNYQGSMSNHDKVYENVVHVLSNNANTTVTTLEALKTVEIIQRIYSAAKNSYV